MPDNGLRAYGFHADEQPPVTRAIRPRMAAEEALEDLGADDLTAQDPETIARRYLANAFASDAIPSLTMPGSESEFTLLGIDESSLKETQTLKFRQWLNGIPVYGSLITVELDVNYELVALNSALGEPLGVSPSPTLTPEDALDVLRRHCGYQDDDQSAAPRLSYFYQTETQRWCLVYVMEDVFCPADFSGESTMVPAVPLADFMIDAHHGQLVDVLPRAGAATVTALDAMNRPRQIRTSFDVVTAGQQLQDPILNVHTQDFAFQDVGASFNNLPGGYVKAPPIPWNPMAVSAHANAELVATFLSTVLRRRGLDDQGGPLVSSINCVWSAMGSSGRHWPNSFWIKDQVVYGQRQAGAQFRSFAVALDMVGHEFFHGVTQFSSRLELKGQTGALNESYSDIFGVLIANGLNPDWNLWRWEIGADTGQPLRDMRQPSRFGHPEHMSQFRNLPPNVDFGGIHTNCGIHNKAAFNIMNAKDPQGRFLFTPTLVAQIFYHSLLVLGPSAGFSVSRRMIEIQAQTILRAHPQRDLMLRAIAEGFAVVGIL